MRRRFRLASVLRARQAQEDAARGAVLRARAGADAAAREVVVHDRRLTTLGPPPGGSVSSFLAALCARQALAAEIAAAASLAEQAKAIVADRLADLTDAAVRRRTMDKLAGRHDAASRAADEAAVQRTIDDLARPARPRLAGPEVLP